MRAPRANIDDQGLIVANALRVSFQRYLAPASGVVVDTPPSLGALMPAMDAHGEIHLACADNEAFWIGLSTPIPLARIRLDIFFGRRPKLRIALPSPTPPRFTGIVHAHGYACLSRAHDIRAIDFEVQTKARGFNHAKVRLVTPSDFVRATGQAPPEPASTEAAFTPRLLP